MRKWKNYLGLIVVIAFAYMFSACINGSESKTTKDIISPTSDTVAIFRSTSDSRPDTTIVHVNDLEKGSRLYSYKGSNTSMAFLFDTLGMRHMCVINNSDSSGMEFVSSKEFEIRKNRFLVNLYWNKYAFPSQRVIYYFVDGYGLLILRPFENSQAIFLEKLNVLDDSLVKDLVASVQQDGSFWKMGDSVLRTNLIFTAPAQ